MLRLFVHDLVIISKFNVCPHITELFVRRLWVYEIVDRFIGLNKSKVIYTVLEQQGPYCKTCFWKFMELGVCRQHKSMKVHCFNEVQSYKEVEDRITFHMRLNKAWRIDNVGQTIEVRSCKEICKTTSNRQNCWMKFMVQYVNDVQWVPFVLGFSDNFFVVDSTYSETQSSKHFLGHMFARLIKSVNSIGAMTSVCPNKTLDSIDMPMV